LRIQKKARRKIFREFYVFKRTVRRSFSFEEIWNGCQKIRFYSAVKEYFEYNEEIPKAYMELVVKEKEPIRKMWETYLKDGSLRSDTWEDLDGILEAMLLKWGMPAAGWEAA